MFVLALVTGAFSNLILALGFAGYLDLFLLNILSLSALVVLMLYFLTKVHTLHFSNLKIFEAGVVGVIALLVGVNFVGVLGPEISYDALWYHLTLSKIYLQKHEIFFIPGSLFHYSTMPKLTEMLFIGGLSLGGEVYAKIIHFSFGIFTSIAIYRLSLKFVSRFFALLAVLIFYSNLVVAWESMAAYIDLARAFYEIMALWAFTLYFESKKKTWLIVSALCVGLAISTKLLALGTLFIFSVLIFYSTVKNKHKLQSTLTFSKNVVLFWVFAVFIPLPWFLFAYTYTRNPFYPLFTGAIDTSLPLQLFNPLYFFQEFWTIFMRAADPINPVYIIIVPLLPMLARRLKGSERLILLYCVTAFFVWYITPRMGGGRFLLPYLPGFSIFVVIVIRKLRNNLLQKTLIASAVFIGVTTLGYRSIANAKFVPVLLGQETKAEFLEKNLQFSFGDFYDVDGYFAQTLSEGDRVLIYGVSKLYYVEFPYIHESYAQEGDAFNYILSQNVVLPERFSDWELVYENKTTYVKLYTRGKKMWEY